MELERLKDKIKPKEIKRPEQTPYYHADSYKKEVSKSIDWAAYKNPLIKEQKKRPDFIKIDYLRFDNKKEYQDLKEAKTGANTRAHTSMDELGAQINNKANAGRNPGDGSTIRKSESTAILNPKKGGRYQTIEQTRSVPAVQLYKLPHKNQRNNARNTQSIKRGTSASSGEEAGFDHYMATPEQKPVKVHKLQKAKG